MIGVAMVGFWHLHAADYAREVDAHPHARLVAVWDDDVARGAAEAAKRGLTFYADLDRLLADPAVEAVVIDSATSTHEDVIVACVRAGKHVFTEKVLAATLASAERIVEAAETAGVTLMVSMRRSDDASAHDIAALVAGGAVGRPTSIRVRDAHPFALASPDHPNGWLPDHFYDSDTAQGGAVIDLCHPVYLVAKILGLPDEVSAVFTRVTGRAVEDNAVVTMTYTGGAIAIAETSYVSAVSPFTIEVHGTDGSLLYAEAGIGEIVDVQRRGVDRSGEAKGPLGKVLVRGMSNDAPRGWVATEPSEGHRSALAQWVDLVQQGRTAPANIALALQLTAIVEAAYRSAAERRPVPVPRPTRIAEEA